MSSASKILASEIEFWERMDLPARPLRGNPDVKDLSSPFTLSSDLCFIERIGDVKGLSVLEVGSGYGNLAFFLSQRGANVIGLELIGKMCKWCKASGHRLGMQCEFVRGNAQELPFEKETFDLIVGMRAIHHFPNLSEFYKEAARVLKPNGRIVLIEPLKGNPIVELNRKILAPELHSETEHPLVRDDIKAACNFLQNMEVETFYLISPAAYLFEKLIPSPRLYALVSTWLQRFEHDFANRGVLQRFCWQAVIVGSKSARNQT